jgi:hypothetical protein
MSKDCKCNMCRLPDSWKKALDKYAMTWQSGKEAEDMGLEFGVPNLIKFVKAIKDEPLPDIKLKHRKLMREMQDEVNDLVATDSGTNPESLQSAQTQPNTRKGK